MEIPATTTSVDYTSATMAPFAYDASLEKFKVSEREYLQEHSDFTAVCTGIVIFNEKGELLLIKRAASERAFPNFWEIPGGKVDEPDESLLHAAVRELKEETSLEATRVDRQVTDITFLIPNPKGKMDRWMKLIFEMEVKQLDVKLEPTEHDDYLFATEDQIESERAGDVVLRYISPDNKRVLLEAFKRRREGGSL
ncbi:hypothetical protein BU23DRAFT_585972 [Bimuria novae-zelandiae CBS 107.79]|uniref:Nudix hydrolase domain-containing protein n=1 Tax=Bimuria novae-zelandiae CBS 107.79 TaxID=1447943 RepID=A0A6A5W406_9PLEO|nr:hypothetical protein BU23DRAFT_585972 [Bimuria novae-zelandiae CBS 107.79]